MSDIRESSRQLAEGISATLSDEERESAQKTAVSIAVDLREVCSEGTPDEIAATISQSITAMLATLSSTSLQAVASLMEHNMCAYALAAGALVGVYELPEVEGPKPQEKLPAPDLSDEWAQTGQYL
jgi:hypothetical protein